MSTPVEKLAAGGPHTTSDLRECRDADVDRRNRRKHFVHRPPPGVSPRHADSSARPGRSLPRQGLVTHSHAHASGPVVRHAPLTSVDCAGDRTDRRAARGERRALDRRDPAARGPRLPRAGRRADVPALRRRHRRSPRHPGARRPRHRRRGACRPRSGLCVFLAYGTTASVARRIGAGDVRGALDQGMDGVWLAVLIGAVVTVAGVLARPGGWSGCSAPAPRCADHADDVPAAGLPRRGAAAGDAGRDRGPARACRTPAPRWCVAVVGNLANIALNLALVYGLDLGIAGSAIGHRPRPGWARPPPWSRWCVRAARREGASLRPDLAGVRRAAHAGVALVVRTLTLRASLLVMTYGAATLGAAVGGHPPARASRSGRSWPSRWTPIAIAAQAIVGRTLGAGSIEATRAVTRGWCAGGWLSGVVTGLALAAAVPGARPAVHRRPGGPRPAGAGAAGRRGVPAGGRGGVRPGRRADRRRGRPLPGVGRGRGARASSRRWRWLAVAPRPDAGAARWCGCGRPSGSGSSAAGPWSCCTAPAARAWMVTGG